MPRYTPEDSMQSPRFTGPSTFARLPHVRTGTPETGGPSAHDLLAIVRRLTGIELVGFDVVEVIPAYDPAGQTATLAANLAYEMLSLVALNRCRSAG